MLADLLLHGVRQRLFSPLSNEPTLMSQLLFTEIEDDKRQAAAARSQAVAAGFDTNRTWCDPASHGEIVGVDFGKGQMHYHALRSGVDSAGVPLDRAADVLSGFSRGTLVVVERAHMATPQTEKSLAQPFTKQQLLEIFNRCREAEVTIRFFPQAHLRKAREWASIHSGSDFVEVGKTTDINDARALAFYVANCNGIALSKPPSNFDRNDKRDYAQIVRARSNVVLQAMKVRGDSGQVFPEIVEFAGRLRQVVCTPNSFIHYKCAVSISSLIVGVVDGRLMRYTYKGQSPGGVMWRRHVLGMSSAHHKAGIARANIARDRFRAWFPKYALRFGVVVKKGKKMVPFGQFTEDQDAVRCNAWKAARYELKIAYAKSLKLAAQLPGYDVLTLEAEEATDGR